MIRVIETDKILINVIGKDTVRLAIVQTEAFISLTPEEWNDLVHICYRMWLFEKELRPG